MENTEIKCIIENKKALKNHIIGKLCKNYQQYPGETIEAFLYYSFIRLDEETIVEYAKRNNGNIAIPGLKIIFTKP